MKEREKEVCRCGETITPVRRCGSNWSTSIADNDSIIFSSNEGFDAASG